jgi:hypothetical protein
MPHLDIEKSPFKPDEQPNQEDWEMNDNEITDEANVYGD